MFQLTELHRRLTEPYSSVEDKVKAAAELKEGIEIVLTAEYASFLSTFFKPFCDILRTVPPQFSDTPEHKLRNTVLDILTRLPQNETIRGHIVELYDVCLSVAQNDNQDNGLPAIKLLLDLQKTYRSFLEAQGSQMVQFLNKCFSEFPATVSEVLDPGPEGGDPPYARVASQAVPSNKSFKVMAEQPFVVMFLMNAYERLRPSVMPQLVPLIIRAACLPGPNLTDPQVRGPLAQQYADFRLVQVRCLQYMLYLLRNAGSAAAQQQQAAAVAAAEGRPAPAPPASSSLAFPIEQHIPAIAEALVHLLRQCPDVVTTRRELMVVTRHMLQTAVRTHLPARMDVLMDERAICGAGRACTETLRQGACGLLAEIVHNCRRQLRPYQLARATYLFASITHDASMPTSTRATCLRAMCVLVDPILQQAKAPSTGSDPALRTQGRRLLGRILESLVAAMKHLRAQASRIMSEARAEREVLDKQRAAMCSPTGAAAALGPDDMLSSVTIPGEKEREVVESRAMLQGLLPHMKHLAFALARYHLNVPSPAPPAPGAPPAAAPPAGPGGLSEEEIRLFARLWSYGLRCLKLAGYQGGSAPLTSSRESYETFAEVFLQLEPRDFVEVISARIPDLFSALLEDKEAMAVLVHMLTGPTAAPNVLVPPPTNPVGRILLAVLLEFMVTHQIPLLSNVSSDEGALTLKLFKLLFAFVSTYSDLEPVLLPHLVKLMDKALRAAVREREALGYLQLLRSFFKALANSSSKWKLMYGAMQPYVEPCLSLVLHMLSGPHPPEMRGVLLDICLQLPAQLTGVLPLLPRLMRPLTMAIKHGPDDLALAAVKTLEVWVDNLNPEFLEPAMAEVVADLMHGLWALLKYNNPLATKALALLGKMGGLNRRWLKDPQPLEYRDNPEHGLRLILTFEPQTSFLVPVDRCVALARAGIGVGVDGPAAPAAGASSAAGAAAAGDGYYRLQALRFLHVCLASMLNLRVREVEEDAAVVEAARSAAGGSLRGLRQASGALLMSPQAAGAGAGAAAAAGGGAASRRSSMGQVEGGGEGVAPSPGSGGSSGGGGDGPQELEGVMETVLKVVTGELPPPQVAVAVPKRQLDSGVKTKTQVVAERQVLVQLLAAVMGAASDDVLAPTAGPFALHVSRHFAMLFVAGIQPPPPAPVMARTATDAAGLGQGPGGPAGGPAGGAAGIQGGGASMLPRGLRELDCHLYLEALVEVLCDKAATKSKSALDCLTTFVDTALLLNTTRVETQAQTAAARPAAAPAPVAGAAPEGAAAAGAGAAPAVTPEQPAGAAAAASAAGTEPTTPSASSSSPDKAPAHGLPTVLDELLPRMLQCCHEDTWQGRVSGAAALRLLLPRLPASYLALWAVPCLRGLVNVIRWLPEYCRVEREDVEATLGELLHKVMHGKDKQAPEGATEPAVSAAAPPVQAPPPTAAAASPAEAERKSGGGAAPAQPPPPQAAAPAPSASSVAPPAGAPEPSSAAVGTTAQTAGSAAPGSVAGSNADPAATAAAPAETTSPTAAAETTTTTAPASTEAAPASAAADSGAPTAATAAATPAPVTEAAATGGGAGAASPGAGSGATAGPNGDSPAAVVVCSKAVVDSMADVLVSAMIGPGLPKWVRAAVEAALGTLAAAMGRTVSSYLTPVLQTMNPPWQFRRLMPIKNVEVTISQVQGLIAVTRQQPPPLPFSEHLQALAQEAQMIADKDEAALAQRLTQKEDDKSAPAAAGGVVGPFAGGKGGPGPRHVTLDALQRLRVACMQLLCALWGWEEFRERPELKSLRESITAMFFKNLTAPSEDIHAVARTGLQLIVSYAKLPKELLQNSLRPLLQNLGTYNKLYPAMLQGLARLLELLSDWFNLTLGDKLLEHLKNWLNPEKHLTGQVLWKSGEEALVASLVLDLFHLLPRTAVKFLETQNAPQPATATAAGTAPGAVGPDGKPVAAPGAAAGGLEGGATKPGLVILTIELEEKLSALNLPIPVPHIMTSPYRGPLTRFLVKYPNEAAAYFLEPARLDKPSYFSRLLDILHAPAGRPLLETVASSTDKLRALLLEYDPPHPGATLPEGAAPPPAPAHPQVAFHSVHLVWAIAKLLPGWLPSQPTIMAAIMDRWHSPNRAARVAEEGAALGPAPTPPAPAAAAAQQQQQQQQAVWAAVTSIGREQLLESKRLAKCVLVYVREHREEVMPLFEIMSVFRHRSSVDYGFIESFCRTVAAHQYSVTQKRAVLAAYVDVFRAGKLPQEQLEKILQILVTPMLVESLERGERDVIGEALAEAVVVDLLDPLEAKSGGQSESLRIELLHLCTQLFKYSPSLLDKHKKELIKFGWNYLKKEDSVTKSYAFVNVAYFLKNLQAPEKIMLQVFVALLKACQQDTKKPLIREALDVLVPTLNEKVQRSAENKISLWVHYTKKVLSEEAQSLASLVHIWQLVLRHSDLFYPSRGQFVGQMVHTLAKLGLQTPTLEYRRLALDLAKLVVGWERKRQDADAAAVPAAAPASPTAAAAGQKRPRDEAGSAGGAADAGGGGGLSAKTPRTDTTTGGGAGSPPGPGTGAGGGDVQMSEAAASPAAPAGAPAAAAPGDAMPRSLSSGSGRSGGGAGPGPAGAAAAGGAGEEEFRPTPTMEETLVNFLARFVLVTPDAVKEDEAALQQGYGMQVLVQALKLWPGTVVKLSFLERLLASAMDPAKQQQMAAKNAATAAAGGVSNAAAGTAPGDPPHLALGLQVCRSLVEAQPLNVLAVNAGALAALVEPCLQSRTRKSAAELGEILRLLHGKLVAAGAAQQQQLGGGLASPVTEAPIPGAPPGTPSPSTIMAAVQRRAEEAISRYLAQAAASPEPPQAGQPAPPPPPPAVTSIGSDPRLLNGLCGSLALLESLEGVASANVIFQCVPSLCKVLQRAAREVVNLPPPAGGAAGARRGASSSSSQSEEPEYGTLYWVLAACIRLLAPRVLHHNEQRKAVLSTMIGLMAGQNTRYMEPSLFLEMLKVMERWLVNPYPGQTGTLSPREATLMVQRLAALEKLNMFDHHPAPGQQGAGAQGGGAGGPAGGVSPLRRAWDSTLLSLVLRLATPPAELQDLDRAPDSERDRYVSDTRKADEYFLHLERRFMMGLRASDHTMRKRFFELYHNHIAPNLYDRLQFVIMVQDWEAMGNSFWLKTALDLLLAALREDELIMLAPNSAQVPPLLPIQQNVYVPLPPKNDPRLMMQQQQQAGANGVKAEVKPEQQDATTTAAGVKAEGGVPAPGGGEQETTEGAVAIKEEPRDVVMGGTGALDPAAAGAGTTGAETGAPGQGQGQVGAAPGETAAASPQAGAAAPGSAPEPMDTSPPGGAEGAAGGPGPAGAADTRPAGGEGAGAGPAAGGSGRLGLRQRFPGTTPEVLELVRGHVEWLDDMGKLRVRELTTSLREYAGADPLVAYHLWVLVFPIIWASLAKEQQVSLAKPIITLLAKEYHHRQANARPNVLQALLEGISLCQPQPKIPPELIKFLGKNYNAWHIAIPLLESHVCIFPDESRCFDSLAELYRLVAEDDLLCGLWRRRAATEWTRTGLPLIQTGHWERAMDALGEATRVFHVPGQRTEQPNRGEQALWVEQWLACCRQLNHWDLMLEYGKNTDQLEVVVDCLWRLSDWTQLKEQLNSQAVKGGAMEDSPSLLMTRAYLALQEGLVQDADSQTNKALLAALHRWWALPDLPSHTNHVGLLQTFQQLVELKESARILVDLAQANTRPDHSFTDLKEILETWRLRTPNDWESLVHWQDVLVWRNQIYNIVINSFGSMRDMAPTLHQLGYKDKAWSVNKLGAVALKHGLPDTCLQMLNTMYGYNAMEVQEAFTKIKEQAEAHLDRGPTDLSVGLSIINTTNLDYFQPPHQAELFRLKALMLQALGEDDHATGAYGTSLALWRNCADTWLSWGAFNDQLYEGSVALAQQAAQQAAAAGGPPPMAPPPMPQLHFLEYAVHCYLQAVRLGSAPARALLPRLLHLLAFDNHNGVVGSRLDKELGEIPPWVWFMWIPQLLASLQRPEAQHVKLVLQQVSAAHPQAVYYWLRVYLLSLREPAQRAQQELARLKAEAERRAAEAAKGGEEGAAPQPEVTAARLDPGRAAEMRAFEAGREVMDVLRSRCSVLTLTLESMLQEIGSKFVPKPEERLLAVVNALLHRCYKVPFANNAEVPALLRKELAGVCKACCSPEQAAATRTGGAAAGSRAGGAGPGAGGGTGGGASGAGAAAASSSNTVQRDIREAFVRDMNPEGPNFPATLGELSEQLKMWRARLQADLEDKLPPCLRLADEARPLVDLSLAEVEMPGQYLGGHEVAPDGIVHLECFGSAVAVVRRHCTSYRRLVLVGSDGRGRHMLVQTGQNNAQGTTDDRIIQLLRLSNRLLDAHPQSRQRALAWHTPVIVPVWVQVRLMEEAPSHCSYHEAYEVNCARYGREPDMPIIAFKQRCADTRGQVASDASSWPVRQQTFQDVCAHIVNENVFSQYAYKSLPSSTHLWAFKKQMCAQTALSALMCHMLLLSGRSPTKILFAKDTGRLYQTDVMPVYNDRGMLEKVEPVPFRLTRNLTAFFTAFGVEGVFTTTMANAAQALTSRSSNAQHFLALFFRDDIVAWAARRSQKQAVSMKNEMLKPLVARNTKMALERVHKACPVVPPEEAAATPPQVGGRPPPAPPPGGAVPLPAPLLPGVVELLAAAQDPQNLCRMEPTWHPWF